MKKNKKNKVVFKIYMIVIIMICFGCGNVLAAEDPISVVNNLSDFIFSLTRAVGLIICGYAVIQIGMSFTTHDPSQRANGIMFLSGGAIITFAKEILNIIAG